MIINRNNFEAYMLDYLESNLDPLLTADLMAFLAENPEFERFLPDYDGSISLLGTGEFGHKELLKKEFSDIPAITPENFDEFCIAFCEGLLNDKALIRLTEYISQHPDRQGDLDIFRKLKLQPDTSVLFTGKSTLKKSPSGTFKLRQLYYVLGIAASIALLIMLVIRKPYGTVYTDILPVPFSSASPNEVNPVEQAAAVLDMTQSLQTVRNTSLTPGQLPEPVRDSLNFIPLKPITRTYIASITETPGITRHLTVTNQGPNQLLAATAVTEKSSDSFAGGFLGSLITKVDLWKTAETALQGFNYLTEAQLSFDKTTDENGKLTGLLLGMESYSISGNKIK